MNIMKEDEDDAHSSVNKTGLANETRALQREFIKTYERLPELWDVTHSDYTNKYKRAKANDILLKVMKKWDYSATRIIVRQKINILRSTYRKDLRKHLQSRTIGPNGEEVFEYIPTNWKFYALRFLGGNIDGEVVHLPENSIAEIDLDVTNFDDEVIEEVENDATSSHIGDVLHTITVSDTVEESPTVINKKNKKQRMISEVIEGHYADDCMLDRELEAISSNVACKLKRMNADQRCYAELLINKVLMGGLKNCLTDDTDLTD